MRRSGSGRSDHYSNRHTSLRRPRNQNSYCNSQCKDRRPSSILWHSTWHVRKRAQSETESRIQPEAKTKPRPINFNESIAKDNSLVRILAAILDFILAINGFAKLARISAGLLPST